MHEVTLIPGDGVGPEVTEEMRRCVEKALDKVGSAIDWDVQTAGKNVVDEEGTPLPERVLDSIRENGTAIKGPITTPVGSGFRSVNVAIRQKLDLYQNVRPCKYYPGVQSQYEDVDIVVFRENTEDLYAGIEFEEGEEETAELIDFVKEKKGLEIREDSGISIKPNSRYASERIVRAAFEYAVDNDRDKVTSVHKANILKHSDGLFRDVSQEVAEDYGIEFEERIVDNMAMQLVQKPEKYDVLVCPNLYGDIISDLCAGLIGGLGVAPGANIGDGYTVFEQVHGSAPKYKGQNKVNPTACILSGMLMLRHLGEREAADILEEAVASVIERGENVTYDLKEDRDDPTAVGTKEMADAIMEEMG